MLDRDPFQKRSPTGRTDRGSYDHSKDGAAMAGAVMRRPATRWREQVPLLINPGGHPL